MDYNFWKAKKTSIVAATHIIQMVDDGYETAKTFGNSLLLPDRYFISVPALKQLAKSNEEGPVRMEIVTKAKRNCVTYELPQQRSEGIFEESLFRRTYLSLFKRLL